MHILRSLAASAGGAGQWKARTAPVIAESRDSPPTGAPSRNCDVFRRRHYRSLPRLPCLTSGSREYARRRRGLGGDRLRARVTYFAGRSISRTPGADAQPRETQASGTALSSHPQRPPRFLFDCIPTRRSPLAHNAGQEQRPHPALPQVRRHFMPIWLAAACRAVLLPPIATTTAGARADAPRLPPSATFACTTTRSCSSPTRPRRRHMSSRSLFSTTASSIARPSPAGRASAARRRAGCSAPPDAAPTGPSTSAALSQWLCSSADK
jgi:hypothetical protein